MILIDSHHIHNVFFTIISPEKCAKGTERDLIEGIYVMKTVCCTFCHVQVLGVQVLYIHKSMSTTMLMLSIIRKEKAKKVYKSNR